MSKKKLIIILTYKYPYNPPVEQFLDKEVRYLVDKNFDLVFMPCARVIDKKKKYDVLHSGSNILCKEIKRNKRIFEGIRGILGLISVDFAKDLFRCYKHEKKHFKERIIDTIKVHMQSYVTMKYIIENLKQIDIEQYKSVVLYSYWFDTTALAICKFRKKKFYNNCNLRAVSRAHGQGDLYDTAYKTRYRPGAELYTKYLNQIYSISEDGKKYLFSQGINNVSIQRLGVEAAWQIDNKQYQLEDTKIVISCSVINENKRVMEIAKSLAGVNCKIKWIHFGGGEKENELRDWCKKNMPINVEYTINGVTKHEDILRFYSSNKISLFINLSKVEGIPVSIMEAFAYGIPCIATDVGATKEIVKNNINGFLVSEQFNIEEVSSLIYKMLEFDNETRNKMEVAASKTWKELFAAETNFSNFSKLLDSL